MDEPSLSLKEYSIALHVAASDTEKSRQKRRESSKADARALRSYERDMLSYAYRDIPPFYTTIITDELVSDVPTSLTIHFPQNLKYQSEGRVETLAELRQRRLALTCAVTDFRDSTISVFHLILRPEGEESVLNEYDVITLIKLWEGGEGVPAPGSAREKKEAKSGTWIGFSVDKEDEVLDLEGVLSKVFGSSFDPIKHPRPRQRSGARIRKFLSRTQELPDEAAVSDVSLACRVGTLELPLPAAVVQCLEWLKERRAMFVENCRSLREENLATLVATGGIVQGLLDFERIDPEELADVFAGIVFDGQVLRGFHKGTLISFRRDEAADDDPPSSRRLSEQEPPEPPMDPYLLVPQSVILYNVERLRTAHEISVRLAEVSKSAPWTRVVQPHPQRIAPTFAEVRSLRTALGNYLPNVFHYPSERALYESAEKVRGVRDSYQDVQKREARHSAELQYRMNRRDTYGALLTFALTFFGTLQTVFAEGDDDLLRWSVLILLGVVIYLLVWMRA